LPTELLAACSAMCKSDIFQGYFPPWGKLPRWYPRRVFILVPISRSLTDSERTISAKQFLTRALRVRARRSSICGESPKNPLTGHSQPVHPPYSSSPRPGRRWLDQFYEPSRDKQDVGLSHHRRGPRVLRTRARISFRLAVISMARTVGQYLFVYLWPSPLPDTFWVYLSA